MGSMALVDDPQVTSEPSDSVASIVRSVRASFDAGTTQSLDWRETQLDGLIRFVDDHTDDLIAALNVDLGRPAVEAWVGDIGPSLAEGKYIKKNFRKWAKPRKTKIPLAAQPGKAELVPEPLGVALIIAPWNYPVNLMLLPIMAAFAAGNAVVAKPSELSPATSELIARNLPPYLDDDAFAIVEGGPEVATALLQERFDHIFFTGSTHVGRIVMEAAAKNLTPVTLELGGKSPCYVADDVDVQVAANRIAWGKGVNAGQTCIAPDYVLVSEDRRDALVAAIGAAWNRFYGEDHSSTSDFGRIVSDRHQQRLVGLLEGQNVAFGGEHERETRYLAPTIVVDPDLESDLMTEEIFGPILPVVTVADAEEAIHFINARPKPLALYVFSDDDDLVQRMLDRTSSGGACVNHTLYHFSPPELSFGGVGPSGIGIYHGQSGFDTFSNLRGVLRKSSRLEHSLGYPPYSSLKERIVRRLL